MYDDRRIFAAQFIDLTAEETISVLDELAGRTYRLVRHNLAEIQDIREEVCLIFRMEDGESIGLLD